MAKLSGFWLIPLVCAGCLIFGAPAESSAQGLPDLSKPGARLGGGERDAALIVAIENYWKLTDVPGAVDNANAWKKYLRDMRGVGEVRVLRNDDATKENIEKFTQKFAAQVKRGGTFWFVFIGHGAPAADGTHALIVGADANADSLQARSVAQRDVVRMINKE